MPQGVWNLEWLNANSQRRYPLAEDASGKDTTGSFTLPADFLLEVDLPVHSGLNISLDRFFIYKLAAYATGFVITVGYQPASGDPVVVGTSLVSRDVHSQNDMYALGGVNDFADTVGKVVIGRLDAIDEQPAGSFTFSLDNARLEPDCIRPIIRGVSALRVVSGTEISEPLYGDIELVADENIQLVPVIVSGQDPQIRISAIKGEGLAEECVCEGNDDGPCVKRINGIPPTPAGDFAILGNDCLKVDGIKNGVRLSDTCSQPCCGCEELEAITRELKRFGSQATTVDNFVTRLEASVTEMSMTVLGQKLNDRGCVQCG